MRLLVLVIPVCFLFSCFEKKGQQTTSDVFADGRRLARMNNKKLQEASGLAASANNEGLLWTLNDSGNKPEVMLINEKLEVVLTCRLEGVKNRDWEDIAVGPGPKDGVSYVYVGEIGDNMAMFDVKSVYRFEEPTIIKGQSQITISEFDTISFRLEEKKDTESLMVDPKTKDLYVVSKREHPVHVYKLAFPQASGDTVQAERLISLPFTQIVAADFSSDGREVLMKNYQNVFYWNLADRSLEEALKQEPEIVKYKEEPQGESVAFARDGSGFYTISELVKGEESWLYFYPRVRE